jgi:hypothetical protein
VAANDGTWLPTIFCSKCKTSSAWLLTGLRAELGAPLGMPDKPELPRI